MPGGPAMAEPVSARARLAELAQQRASEKQLDYVSALREIIAEQPTLFEHAQVEY
jgi:hypothetical protein